MPLDTIQTGSVVAAVTSLVGNVALYFDKKRTDRATLAAIQAQPAPSPAPSELEKHRAELRTELRLELERGIAESKSEYARALDQLRAEVAAAKNEVATAKNEVAKLSGENAALRVTLAETNGEMKALKVRADQTGADLAGVLAREHTEATARGKLMSRVEYMIGTLEGRSSSGD